MPAVRRAGGRRPRVATLVGLLLLPIGVAGAAPAAPALDAGQGEVVGIVGAGGAVLRTRVLRPPGGPFSALAIDGAGRRP